MSKYRIALGCLIIFGYCATLQQPSLIPEAEVNVVKVQRKDNVAVDSPDQSLPLMEDEPEREGTLEQEAISDSHHKSATVEEIPMIKQEEISVQKNSTCVVWLHTLAFVEGLAAQKRTLEKLLELAKLVNARFVEPCINNGKMLSCQNVKQKTVGKIVRYSDLFDLNSLKRIYANIAPYEEFKRVKEYDQFCLKVRKKSSSCKKYEERGTATIVTIGNITSVIEDRRRAGCSRDIVLLVPQMRKENLRELKTSYPSAEFYSKYYVIKENHYNFVRNSIFPELGIKENSYSVIHWRGEKVKTDLVTCARALVRAKESMAKELPKNHRFVLMTYLRRPETFKFQWDNKRKDVQAQDKALDILENNSFVSLDSTINLFSQEIDDGSFMALWDLVIAQGAHSFVTCTRKGVENSCPAAEICKACNHLGTFAHWAISLREIQNKTSEHCWPTL